jgi:hypothetical protein
MEKDGYETGSIFEKVEKNQNKIFDLNLKKDTNHQQPLQPSSTSEKASLVFDSIVFNILGRQLDIVKRQTEAFKNLTDTLKELLSKLESQNKFNKRISELEDKIEQMKKVQDRHGHEIGHMCLEWFKGGKKSWWSRIFSR